MDLEASPSALCVVCGASASQPVLSRLDPRDGYLALRRCEFCRTVFLAGWSDAFQPELYDYYGARADRTESELFSDLNDRRCREIAHDLKALVRSDGRRLLDVGCGYGQFVRSALADGWDAEGIDLAESAVALGRRFRLPLHRLDFFDRALERPYDVVTMFEFIEHVPRPTSFIRRAGEILSAGGILHLTTPNFASLDRRVIGSGWRAIGREHISYFTPETLEHVLRAVPEFEVVSIETRGISPTALLRALRRSPHAGGANAATASSPASVHQSDRRIRRAIQGSTALHGAKKLANSVLSATELGNTIVASCRRR